MKLRQVATKDLLECVKCGRHFRYNEMVERDRMLYNSKIVMRYCPYCNSYEVEPVREQRRAEKYRFLNTNEERN